MTTVNDEYKFKKLDAFAQFNIVRRLAPFIGDFLALLNNEEILKKGVKLENTNLDDIDFDMVAKHLTPIMETLAKIPDEDVNYVMMGLLKVAERKQIGGGWAPVTTGDGKHIMFEDLKTDMVAMLTVCVKSFSHNLGGFLSALPSGLKEGALKSTANG